VNIGGTALDFQAQRGVVAGHFQIGGGGAFISAIGVFEGCGEFEAVFGRFDLIALFAYGVEDRVDGEVSGLGASGQGDREE
jgi:hypothetical protein